MNLHYPRTVKDRHAGLRVPGCVPGCVVSGLVPRLLAWGMALQAVSGLAMAETLRPLDDVVDQRAHIQAALDALPPQRNYTAELKLEGEFVLRGPLRLDSFTRLDMRAARLSLQSYEAVSVLVNRNGKEGGERQIEVIGGEIIGNREELGVAGASCIELYRTRDVTIEGVTIRDCARDGILLSGRGQRTYDGLLRDLVLEDNLRHGLAVVWAMRNIRVDSILSRRNGGTGVYSDHSESDYHNIRASGNGVDGIFVRNVFHNNYENLFAINNGRHGIRVLGMVESSGRGWNAYNNGRRDSSGLAANVFFSSEALSYGITRDTRIDGIMAGYSSWVESGQARYALYVQPSVDSRVDYIKLELSGVMLSGPLSVPASSGVSVSGR